MNLSSFISFAFLTYQALPLQDRYRHHPPIFHSNSWLHDGNGLSILSTYQAIAEEYAVPLRLQVQEDLKVLLMEVRQNKQNKLDLKNKSCESLPLPVKVPDQQNTKSDTLAKTEAHLTDPNKPCGGSGWDIPTADASSCKTYRQ